MQSSAPSPLLSFACQLAEGPFWWNDAWWWVDIEKGRLHRWTEAEGEAHREVGQRIGVAIPVAGQPQRFLAGLENGLAWLDWSTGAVDVFANPEADKPNNRFNDGKCDPRGRLFIGSMSMRGEKGAGSLYRVDRDLRARRVLDNVTISNGLAWNRAGDEMFYIDTPSAEIKVFAYDLKDGSVGKLQRTLPFSKKWGHPDGMSIDDQDHLWIACWAGKAVRCLDPREGALLQEIQLPAENVTCCAFGEPDRRTLLITTAGGGRASEQSEPVNGNVYRHTMEVPGAATVPFELA